MYKRQGLPDNLDVAFDTTTERFWDLARRSRLSIVSVGTGVTSGLVVLILTWLIGRPVVCARTPATEAYYPEQCSELLVDPRDVAAFARQVTALWEDAGYRMAVSTAVQDYILETHSPEAWARRLATVIRAAGAHADEAAGP